MCSVCVSVDSTCVCVFVCVILYDSTCVFVLV